MTVSIAKFSSAHKWEKAAFWGYKDPWQKYAKIRRLFCRKKAINTGIVWIIYLFRSLWYNLSVWMHSHAKKWCNLVAHKRDIQLMIFKAFFKELKISLELPPFLIKIFGVIKISNNIPAFKPGGTKLDYSVGDTLINYGRVWFLRLDELPSTEKKVRSCGCNCRKTESFPVQVS